MALSTMRNIDICEFFVKEPGYGKPKFDLTASNLEKEFTEDTRLTFGALIKVTTGVMIEKYHVTIGYIPADSPEVFTRIVKFLRDNPTCKGKRFCDSKIPIEPKFLCKLGPPDARVHNACAITFVNEEDEKLLRFFNSLCCPELGELQRLYHFSLFTDYIDGKFQKKFDDMPDETLEFARSLESLPWVDGDPNECNPGNPDFMFGFMDNIK